MYRLPLVVAAVKAGDPVYVCEGEKDVHALEAAGVVATCNPMGAGKWRDEYRECLRGAAVTVIADRDKEGRRHAANVARSLEGVVTSVRVVEPAIGKDASEHLAAGKSITDFESLLLAQPPTVNGHLTATPTTEIAMRSIEWFEKPLWQGSAFTLLAGEKGAGKGSYLAGLAARMNHTGRNVLFVSSEDSASIDLVPRLVAAGADRGRCFVIRQHVQLPADIDALRDLAAGVGGVGMFVIDPMANHIGDSNSNNDVEVRHAIAPLNKLADDLACLLIGVRHIGKDRMRGALASILGSTAWVDTPRAVVVIAKDDIDPASRVIQVKAGNRSPNGAALAFRLEAVEVAGLTEPITLAVDLGESSKDVDDLLAPRELEQSKTATPES